jgi:hypothetical protein
MNKPGVKLGQWLGGIRNLQDMKNRCRIDDETNCWHWLGGKTGGKYPKVCMKFNGKERAFTGVKTVMLLMGKEVGEGLTVYHYKCNSLDCLNPAHLRIGTHKEKWAHIKEMGYLRGDPARAAVNKAIAMKRCKVAEKNSAFTHQRFAPPVVAAPVQHRLPIRRCSLGGQQHERRHPTSGRQSLQGQGHPAVGLHHIQRPRVSGRQRHQVRESLQGQERPSGLAEGASLPGQADRVGGGEMSKRKAYRPRWLAKPVTLQLAIQGVAKLSKADQEAKAAPVREAVEAITKGEGTKEHWSALFDALNMVEQFNQMPSVMKGAKDYIEAMQSVIVAILDRQREGRRALYPAELQDLQGFADLWVDVLSTVTHREYFVCQEKTHKRLVASRFWRWRELPTALYPVRPRPWLCARLPGSAAAS